MFTYIQLKEACLRAGIVPDTQGKNIEARSYPCSTFEKPFNLRKIKFPKKELKEVENIGQLINNLISQKKFPSFYNLGTKEGREESCRDNAIDEILPLASKSLEYWLKVGLRASVKPKNDLVLHNGKVYENNPAYHKAVLEMNERLLEFRRDFRRKAALSEISAQDVILNA